MLVSSADVLLALEAGRRDGIGRRFRSGQQREQAVEGGGG